ncbi:MAG: DUF3792 family protein [Clostridia bacterium]|nr:DUF3792 family protein [Clostridia bacterium]
METSHKNNSVFSAMLTGICIAQLFVVGIGLLLLLVFCAIACQMKDPDSVILPLSLCALYISSLAGGFAAVRISGDGILSGLISGGLTMLLVRLLSLLPLPPSQMTPLQAGIFFALIPAASVCGSVIGKKRKSAKPRHRVRRR